jgi:TonB family protein
MALRALLFSKNPETADSLTAVLREAGIHAEVCADIFAAMEKGTKQPFACVIVDWSEQPEAGFLLKRTRESGPNRMAVAIAIVDGDPSPEEERENRLDFLIFQPIVADEARAVLAKARQQMQLQSTAYATDAAASLDHPELQEPSEPQPEDPNLVSIASELPDSVPQAAPEEQNEETTFGDEPSAGPRWSRAGFQAALAAALMLTAVFCSWKSRDVYQYLGRTPEGTFHVLQESATALFYVNKSGAQPVGATMSDVQQDAYFRRTPANTNTQAPALGVVSADIALPDTPMPLRPAFDFPLPTPELHLDPLPVRTERAAVPDSLKTSAPIARPVVLTVNPAQMMPVSAPPPSSPLQQYGEPVHLSEDSARALVLQSVDPVYPPEALPQKLQGTVVLQAVIGRDGSVQDLKLVRGYFVLGRAAIAAVKQWRFRPYSQNGHTLETQTVITINFSYPPG